MKNEVDYKEVELYVRHRGTIHRINLLTNVLTRSIGEFEGRVVGDFDGLNVVGGKVIGMKVGCFKKKDCDMRLRNCLFKIRHTISFSPSWRVI